MIPSSRLLELYNKYGPKIAAIIAARSRLPSTIIQDAVQDVFLVLFTHQEPAQKIQKMNDRDAFRYLLKSVQYRAIREARRLRSREVGLEEALNISADESTGMGISGILKECIQQIKEPYQEVLRLFLLEEKTASEIAHDLNRSANTIYQQIHRGLGQLRMVVRKAQPG